MNRKYSDREYTAPGANNDTHRPQESIPLSGNKTMAPTISATMKLKCTISNVNM